MVLIKFPLEFNDEVSVNFLFKLRTVQYARTVPSGNNIFKYKLQRYFFFQTKREKNSNRIET
jgi:hypothetical protein